MNKLNRTKRTAAAGISFLILLVLLTFPVFAAQGRWQQEPYSGRWRWQTADGYYYSSCWQWLDGNGDGICECYYFDPEGYCLQGTQTPDGYYVNADGAWTVNGTVQTRTSAELKAIASYSGYEGVFGDDHGDVTVTVLRTGSNQYLVRVEFFWALLTDNSTGYVSSDKNLYFRGTDSHGEELYGAFYKEDKKNSYGLSVAYADWDHIFPHDTIRNLHRKSF